MAVVSDDRFLEVAPTIASWFVAAELRHFDADQRDAALAWLNRTNEP